MSSQRIINVTLREEEVEAFCFALSDVLCWCAGFKAAREGTGMDDGPISQNKLRDLNIKLKNALRDAGERTTQ